MRTITIRPTDQCADHSEWIAYVKQTNLKLNQMRNELTFNEALSTLVIQTSNAIILNVELLQRELVRNGVKVMGELERLHSFSDGSILVRDTNKEHHTQQHKFYKVDNNKIKIGRFKKGKLHYSDTLINDNNYYIPKRIYSKMYFNQHQG